MLEQVLAFWTGLGLKRQGILVGAGLGVFLAVLGLARIAATPSMALLYSGLDPMAAGEVVAALEAQGAEYEIRGEAIYVEAPGRDALRMSLAGEGLPANGTRGYELLDNLTGFGTTSQMFDATYWRAKEGELARTIAAARHVSSARVHVATPNDRSFSRNMPLSASVTVTTANGALSLPHAKALRYLVASAVAGLEAENVAIIDTSAGLVATGEDRAAGFSGGGDLAAQLRANAERLLEARVGYGNAVVELHVETSRDRETISERRFDPESRIAISTDTEERSDSSSDSRSGAVTVASNLPDGDGAGSGQSSNASVSETRERINYEVSQTEREIHRQPGEIRRISVAILVDGIRGPDPSDWSPRSDEELADLRDLVAAAVGINVARGDEITIKSLQFEPVAEVGTVAPPGILGGAQFDIMSTLQLGVLALVALALGFGVLRPILLRAPVALPGPSDSSGTAPAGLPAPPAAPGELPPLPPLDGEIDFPIEMATAPSFSGEGGGGLPALGGSAGGDAVSRLRDMIEERQEDALSLLQSWVDDEEEVPG